MVWSCKIISKGFRAVLSDKDRTCISYLHHIFKRILCDDLHMFRSNFIGSLNGLVHIFCDQDITKVLQGFLNNGFSGKYLNKTSDFFIYLICKFLICCDQDRRCHLIMFCLRKKICCNITRICSLICKNEDLAWTGNRINAYVSINCLFCKRNKNISGSYDLVNLWNTLGSICKCSDGLCTTHFIDFICSGFVGSNKCAWIYFSVFSRRCCHYNTVNTGNFCRNDIHKHGRRIYSLSTGNVNTYTVQSGYLLTKHGSVCCACEPAVLKLLFVIAADIHQCFFDHIDQGRIYQLVCFLDLLRGYTDRILCHFDFIKFSGKCK